MVNNGTSIKVSPSRYPELSEQQRFPILSDRGRKLLHQLRQHPHAPIWNWPNGEQLDGEDLTRVLEFANALNRPEPQAPSWLALYVERCLREVPFYRKRAQVGCPFEELPTFRRADLAPRVWEFVPDDEPLEKLITFSSSGTTGYPTRTAHHPFSAACGVPLLEYALQTLCGISLNRSSDHVAIANLVAYPDAYTTAIVVAYLKEAGCIRLNLDKSAWRAEGDCVRYLPQWRAPVWLGDPIAFGAIEKLSLDHQPQAILSSIMQLTDAYARQLHERYACPVIDLYAMTEAGIIAARDPLAQPNPVHRILPHDLFVEILDEQGQRCPDGVRGEITLTGGRNPYLPLLRYRTGDFAAMETIAGELCLVGLEGRLPVQYTSAAGRVIHSMEITRLMRRYPVLRYEMKIAPDGRHELHYQGDIDSAALQEELGELFRANVLVVDMQPTHQRQGN